MARTTSKALPAAAAPLTPSQLSERRVCGWLLQHLAADHSTVRSIGETCQPDDFEDRLLAAVLKAALRLEQQQQPIDLVTIAPELERDGWRDRDLVERLESIAKDAPVDAESAVIAARDVHRAALQRKVKHLAGMLADAPENQKAAQGLLQVHEELMHGPEGPAALIGWYSEVQPEEPVYLWDQRIPKGALTILAGEEGKGKSLLSLYLAAAVTTGRPLEDDPRPRDPRRVLLIGREDARSTSVRPRIEAAEGDPSRMAYLKRNLLLPEALDPLEQLIQRFGFVLVVVDPLVDVLAPDLNTSDGQHVRRVLRPLQDMAQRTGAAVLGIMHVNKGDQPARGRISGSVAFPAVARSVFVFADDPRDKARRVLAQLKVNDTPSCASLAWSIESRCWACNVTWQTGDPNCPKCGKKGWGRVRGHGPCSLTAAELFPERTPGRTPSRPGARPVAHAAPTGFEERVLELLSKPEHKGGLSKSKILELLSVADKPAGMKLLATMVQARKLEMREEGQAHICCLPYQRKLDIDQ